MISGRIEIESTVREYFYKYCLLKWKELKRSSKLLQLIESKECVKEQMEKTWKEIELNKMYMGQVMALQEGATIIGQKLATSSGREEYRWCRKGCKTEETLDHVLSTCPRRKKEQIARHDEVGKEIYRAIGEKYGLIKHYVDKPGVILTEEVDILWNKRILEKYGNNNKIQPDITVIDRKGKEIITFDMSIVKKENLQKAYEDKIKDYEETTRKTKD